jgi:cell division ATPase FtsA
MLLLPNGKPIDTDMLEIAMEDADLNNIYHLNTDTGEVVRLSDFDDDNEQQLEEIEGNSNYIAVERVSSHEAYQWMVDFVAEIVEPKDEQVAEKLSIALMGKGAFRRFKDVLYRVGEEWVQAWYQWKGDRLHKAMKQWFEELHLTTTEE